MNLFRLTKKYIIVICSLIALAAIFISGCQSLPKNKTVTTLTNDNLYLEAQNALTNGDWNKCAKYFEILQGRYTLSHFMRQAQINIAYCKWKDNEPYEAEQAVNRFIKLNPDHPSVAYAYYLKGIIHFNCNFSLFSKFFDQNISERDPKTLQESYDAFKTVVARFPKSRYAVDAASRIRYIRNTLALHEIHIADYYYRRAAYIAAINRAQVAIKEYKDVPEAIEDALDIMILSYDKLNQSQLSKSTKYILATMFPNSHYIIDNYKRPVIKRAWWQF